MPPPEYNKFFQESSEIVKFCERYEKRPRSRGACAFSRFAVYPNLLDYWAAGTAIGSKFAPGSCQLALTFKEIQM